jgi:hypothetical protein
VRALAQRFTKKEHVNPPFPVDVFDIEAAEQAVVRVLYKLSEIDEFARKNPMEKVTGFISVLVTEVHVVSNFKRNMLMSTECCGLPIFANAVTAKCRQCEKENALRINPRIVRILPHFFATISMLTVTHSNSSAPSLTKRAKSLEANSFSRMTHGYSSSAAAQTSSSRQNSMSCSIWNTGCSFCG